MVVAKSAGSFLGSIANNPGIIAIAAIGLTLFIFRDRISEFFAGLKFPEIPAIEFPEFPAIEFPEFPEFPELPDFGKLFEDFFSTFTGGGNGELQPPPAGDLPSEGLGDVTIPEGCFVNSQGIIECPTPPTFDVCQSFPELCEPTPPMDPALLDEPSDAELFAKDFPEPFDEPEGPEPPFEPPIDLPEGFTGEGISFEGGTIFERDPCFMSLSEIIDAGLASSASAAANVKAIACSANVTDEPTDFPEDFDFGTSTGSGFGPGDDPTGGIVTGGATLESEEKKAACVSCELFGLNCPICAGTI